MIDLNITRKQGSFLVRAAFNGPNRGVTALYGPSGAGKTSIVNMVAGMLRPDTGRIAVNGRVLFDGDRRINLPPEKRRIGYVFQDGRLLPHLSVKANLTYGMSLTPAAERFIHMDQVVDLLGIGHILERRPSGLSGGEKQRVAIGRALLTSPGLLLMDEPLASLDQARKHEVLPFIRRLCREFSLPVLYVSHNLEEVLNLANQLVLMDNGRPRAVGSLEELMSHQELAPLLSRDDFGAVINTHIVCDADEFGLTHLAFTGGILKVPRLEAADEGGQGRSLRIHIPARNVGLALRRPEQSSFQNIYYGTIDTISDGHGPFVTVKINVGSPLLARITVSAKRSLGLAPGKQVYAMVKSVNVSPSGFD